MLDTRTSAQASYFDAMAALLGVGVRLDRTLDALAAAAPSAELGAETRRLAAAVRAGQELSVAMAASPMVFGPRAVAFVRAGEVGGVLDVAAAALGRALRATTGLVAEAGFCHLLGVLLQAGVPVAVALSSAAQVLDAPRRDTCLRAAEALGEPGASLAGALREAGGFAPLTVEFVAAGEQTGRLDQLCLRAAELLGSG